MNYELLIKKLYERGTANGVPGMKIINQEKPINEMYY